MWGFIHDKPGYRDCMNDMFKSSNTSATSVMVHYTCIKGNLAVSVRIPPEANRMIFRVCLWYSYTLLYRINGISIGD